MNVREKGLAGCLVGVIVAYGGYVLVKSQVYEPRKRLLTNIREAAVRREKLQNRLSNADQIVQAWQEHTQRTLDEEWFPAHQAFREEVEALLKRNNLTEGLSVGQPPEKYERKSVREGFVTLPVSVHAEGKLADVVNFLKDFYQLPYMVRVDKLHLRAKKMRTSRGRKAAGGAPEPKLDITMTLSTLVLPKVNGVDHPTIDLVALNDPASDISFDVPLRLREDDPVAYNKIANVNLFKVYQPPPRKPEPKPEPREVVKREPEPTPKLPPDPRRDADKYMVSGVGQLPQGPIVYVLEVDNAMVPPQQYRLNDEIDDGKLVLIVPQGIVVRVTSEKGKRGVVRHYFYPLGATFKEREELDPAEHPEVARQLRLVLNR
jgi:Tfp pilus assembly protein PilO